MPNSFSIAINNIEFEITCSDYACEAELKDECPHKHQFIEFHYIYSGKERLILPIEQKDETITKGQLLIIPRGIYHHAKTDISDSVSRLCFNMNVRDESPVFQIINLFKTITVLNDSEICEKMEKYREVATSDNSALNETKKGIILADLIIDILKKQKGFRLPVQTKETNRQKQKWIIDDFICTKYFSCNGIKDLADSLYLSERRTRELVKQFYGKNFKELIIRHRMEMAQILLKQNNLSLEEIASTIGYSSYSGFHLSFIKQFGITPGEYRKNYLKS